MRGTIETKEGGVNETAESLNRGLVTGDLQHRELCGVRDLRFRDAGESAYARVSGDGVAWFSVGEFFPVFLGANRELSLWCLRRASVCADL